MGIGLAREIIFTKFFQTLDLIKATLEDFFVHAFLMLAGMLQVKKLPPTA